MPVSKIANHVNHSKPNEDQHRQAETEIREVHKQGLRISPVHTEHPGPLSGHRTGPD